MKTYAGIDLHSSNNFIGIINEQDERLYQKRIPNNLNDVLTALDPFKESLEGIVVESTYNWYWLVDGLQDNGYHVHLANPSAIQQYDGLKHTDDKWDSFWLAHMRRLNILPEGYIYPKDGRPTRDLLRRRLFFVKQRTAQILSFQSMLERETSLRLSGREIKKLKIEEAKSILNQPELVFTAENFIATIKFFSERIKSIEQNIVSQVKLVKEFELLRTIPGIGEILGLTIMLEVGDINRFPKVSNYSSYCRCVKSTRYSNNKKKGQNNKKNGNKYLAWAYVEAANFAIRFSKEAQRFYHKKKSQTNSIVAIKALGNKLSRASYYIMRDQVPYDEEKLFQN